MDEIPPEVNIENIIERVTLSEEHDGNKDVSISEGTIHKIETGDEPDIYLTKVVANSNTHYVYVNNTPVTGYEDIQDRFPLEDNEDISDITKQAVPTLNGYSYTDEKYEMSNAELLSYSI